MALASPGISVVRTSQGEELEWGRGGDSTEEGGYATFSEGSPAGAESCSGGGQLGLAIWSVVVDLFTGPCAWNGCWADYLQGRLLKSRGPLEGRRREREPWM